MDNQHKKIKGYRDLSQQEIDLMNRIKEHGEATKKLLDELEDLRFGHQNFLDCGCPEECATNLSQEQVNESYRSLWLAKEHLQTGQMWFVRAVALPDSF